ncbi:hypothetical protein ckin129_14880 [Helicobacter pylori]
MNPPKKTKSSKERVQMNPPKKEKEFKKGSLKQRVQKTNPPKKRV